MAVHKHERERETKKHEWGEHAGSGGGDGGGDGGEGGGGGGDEDLSSKLSVGLRSVGLRAEFVERCLLHVGAVGEEVRPTATRLYSVYYIPHILLLFLRESVGLFSKNHMYN